MTWSLIDYLPSKPSWECLDFFLPDNQDAFDQLVEEHLDVQVIWIRVSAKETDEENADRHMIIEMLATFTSLKYVTFFAAELHFLG
jgi:hypothetical protein